MSTLTLDMAVKILVALVLGGMIGWQRQRVHKPAGLRTHILIVLGATAVMEVSRFAGEELGGDPTRIASNIIVGLGFIGAGTIMKEGPTVYGLTTAASIWVAGALGLMIGSGYYGPSVLLTLATLLVLVVFGKLESIAGKKEIVHRYHVVAQDSDRVIERVRQALDRVTKPRCEIDFRRDGEKITLSFELVGPRGSHDDLFNDLRSFKEVLEIRSV